MNYFKEYFSRIDSCVRSIENNVTSLQSALNMMDDVRDGNRKIILSGNGGSAAMASHVTVDMLKIAKLRAMNFNEADLITCYANDYGYAHWLERAIESYADQRDMVILISSSGKSQNIINAALKAKEMNLPLITFSGFSPENSLRKLGDVNFWANSSEYNIVEMTHHIWLLALVDKFASSRAG